MKSTKFILVGMPASGKSTVGKLLASQLGINFIDLDDEIVRIEGFSITDIFTLKGEEYFRRKEREVLQKILNQKTGFVLATGGGAPCFFDNMDKMNDIGITIFINVPVEELYNKLSRKGTKKRPLLKNISQSELYSELKKKFEDRKKHYNKSRICLDQKLEEVTSRVNQVIFAIKTLEEKTNG